MHKLKPHILFTTQLTPKKIMGMRSWNVKIESEPFITFEYFIPALWKAKVPEQVDAWIFTSKKAVKAIKPMIKDLEVPEHIFAVGTKTAQKLEDLDLTVTVPDEYNVAALAKKMKDLKLKNAVHFCGNLKASDLSSLLDKKTKLTSIEVYRTKLTGHEVDMDPYDGVVFMSPSAVESFMMQNTVANSMPVFCIGPTTEEAALRAGLENCITPEYSTMDSLLDSIKNHFTDVIS